MRADELAARAALVGRSPDLAALARRLRQLLEPLLDRPLYLPQEKALWSRDGGVCPVDGARLVFDPLSPDEHRCPRCGEAYRGERHYRAWIWRYHLWLSERAIHLAVLGALLHEPALAQRAREILSAYAELYPRVPNRDNVLGPTRLFFSTYLESIWLAQLVLAAAFLRSQERGARSGALDSAFSAPVAESAELIRSFDEGLSNRQVWNNTALVAAAGWLDDETLLRHAVDGAHGLRVQLAHGVTADGLWFEGENYHFFALRGFLLAAELLRWLDLDLYADDEIGERLRAMYTAPLDTVLPDLTLPARGDAPFGVTLRQPRFAELWEIGWARTGAERLAHILTTLYAWDGPPAPEVGFAEIAEQEVNRPPVRVTRRGLGWKALLWMVPEAPRESPDQWRAGSRLLPSAGVAILRGGASRYVSVECGGRAGGHGHPDLLHLTIYWDRPFLADFGTGSYASPSLHWYRSTLAHNAPGVVGIGQLARRAWCAAFDEERGEGWAWCRVVAREILGPHSEAIRTVVLGPAYVVDVVEVDVPASALVDLPAHPLDGVATDGQGTPGATLLEGAALGHEHGYDAVQHVCAFERTPQRVCVGSDAMRGEIHLAPRDGEVTFVAQAPGPPDAWWGDGAPLPFLLRRARGAGRWVQVYAAPGIVQEVREDGAAIAVKLADGAVERFELDADTARITDRSRRVHVLGGRQPAPAPSPPHVPREPPTVCCPRVTKIPPVADWIGAMPSEAVVTLGADHYRRAEAPYGASGLFAARVAVFAAGSRLCFAAQVTKGRVCFRAADAPDPALDNEVAEIHSDGLQCYLDVRGWEGYLVIPDQRSHQIRVLPVAGTAGDPARVAGWWTPVRDGYAVLVAVETGRAFAPGDRLPVNLVVNEMYPELQRRAGQLALSGGGGWVYLRGDREAGADAAVAEVV